MVGPCESLLMLCINVVFVEPQAGSCKRELLGRENLIPKLLSDPFISPLSCPSNVYPDVMSSAMT